MALIFNDLLDRLEALDEVTLLELLEINSEEIVTKFIDRIYEKADYLMSELEDEEEDQN